METLNNIAEILIEKFDDSIEDTNTLDEAKRNDLASIIPSVEALSAGLPALLQKANEITVSISDCDKNIKNWQESKKLWSARLKAFTEVLGTVLEKLKVPGESLKADGIKLRTSKRTCLDVDEEWLVGQYRSIVDAIQKQLPEYIVLSMSVDKTKLMAYVNKDDKMLIEHPDKIHTRVSRSTSIK